MSLASVAAQQTSAQAATPLAAGTAAQAGAAALSSLSGNFQNFLKLLMTQLKNQDPTSPLDTNQFTSQLVQFASVEQQINTNTSMTQLIQLTQSGQVMQSSAILGKQVEVTSDHVPLQSGAGTVKFATVGAQPVTISIHNDAGATLRDAVVSAATGGNTWTWDGKDNTGRTVADGSYRVAVMGVNVDGTSTGLPFSVAGTATGVQVNGNTMQLQLGALAVNFNSVRSVGGAVGTSTAAPPR